ncbi:MAG: 30S ribosomal protein S20 [Spirochaetales bacterium]|nr:30S ribosomal protein S20 [Spirochaetales bacterium]
MSGKGSAVKRHQQSEKRRLRNKKVKSQIRTSTRKLVELVKAGPEGEAEGQFREVSSLLDGAVNKGIVHRNTAARKKRRLQKRLAATGSTSS